MNFEGLIKFKYENSVHKVAEAAWRLAYRHKAQGVMGLMAQAPYVEKEKLISFISEVKTELSFISRWHGSETWAHVLSMWAYEVARKLNEAEAVEN